MLTTSMVGVCRRHWMTYNDLPLTSSYATFSLPVWRRRAYCDVWRHWTCVVGVGVCCTEVMTSQKYDEVSPCRSDADRLRRMHRPLYSFASSPLVHGYAYTKFRTFGETTAYIQQRCVQGRLKLMCFFIRYECELVLLRFCEDGQSCSSVASSNVTAHAPRTSANRLASN